jgi:hypothetical protein
MTNKDKTGTSRQRTRRLFEHAWLKSQGYTSWDVIHTKLMNGELILDSVTPAYSNRNIDKLNNRLDSELSQLADALINDPLKALIKKGKQS